jgi:hypothetical protein
MILHRWHLYREEQRRQVKDCFYLGSAWHITACMSDIHKARTIIFQHATWLGFACRGGSLYQAAWWIARLTTTFRVVVRLVSASGAWPAIACLTSLRGGAPEMPLGPLTCHWGPWHATIGPLKCLAYVPKNPTAGQSPCPHFFLAPNYQCWKNQPMVKEIGIGRASKAREMLGTFYLLITNKTTTHSFYGHSTTLYTSSSVCL